jgi:hypothetical protein
MTSAFACKPGKILVFPAYRQTFQEEGSAVFVRKPSNLYTS